MYRILIVDDNANFTSTLKIYLEQESCEVVTVKNFEKVMEYLNNVDPHLILLGANLPVLDGLYWLQKIRFRSTCPIIFISNCKNEKKQIQAIEKGADDCIIPPLNYKVIVTKIKRYLRRTYGEYILNPLERFIEVKGVIFYPERFQLQFKTSQVTLTNNERTIIELLFSHYPRTVVHNKLSSAISTNEESVSKNTLYKNIIRVNKKFDILGVRKAIKVVSKIGYRLDI
ncbi:response regulator transcription factor [Bacillus cereus]|uniref:response regulator transcription factor n=1 Tax=Bacillus cereus TaxID=1396 RepID=UPI000BF91BAA|nr:response regulator transcription factor [Bacillus cereus]PFI79102.1 transcriptional regulator [Bacillus cereus]